MPHYYKKAIPKVDFVFNGPSKQNESSHILSSYQLETIDHIGPLSKRLEYNSNEYGQVEQKSKSIFQRHR